MNISFFLTLAEGEGITQKLIAFGTYDPTLYDKLNELKSKKSVQVLMLEGYICPLDLFVQQRIISTLLTLPTAVIFHILYLMVSE